MHVVLLCFVFLILVFTVFSVQVKREYISMNQPGRCCTLPSLGPLS